MASSVGETLYVQTLRSSFPSSPSAPCMPTNLMLNLKNSSSAGVSWTANNSDATYTVSASGDDGRRSCTTGGNSCDITDLPCGSTYDVSVTATGPSGQSLPSYSDSLETGESNRIDPLHRKSTDWYQVKRKYKYFTLMRCNSII